MGAGLTPAVPAGPEYSCSSRGENKYYPQPDILLDAAHAVLNGKANRAEDIPGIFPGGKLRFSKGTEASFGIEAALERLG